MINLVSQVEIVLDEVLKNNLKGYVVSVFVYFQNVKT